MKKRPSQGLAPAYSAQYQFKYQGAGNPRKSFNYAVDFEEPV